MNTQEWVNDRNGALVNLYLTNKSFQRVASNRHDASVGVYATNRGVHGIDVSRMEPKDCIFVCT